MRSGAALNFYTLSRARNHIARVGTLARVLIAPQVAVALVLMTATISFTVSLIELQRVDFGFNPTNAVVMSVPATRQPTGGTAGGQAVFDEVLERAGRIPGVSAAGATSALPLGDSDVISVLLDVIGQPSPKEFKNRFAMALTVTLGYFRAIGMKLLAGRFFNPHDTAQSAPVAVVNRTLAEQYGGERRILGQRVTLPGKTAPVEIVGVVGDVRQLGLDTEPGQQIFLPHAQSPVLLQTFVFRCDDRLPQIATDVRAIIAKHDPSLPIYNVLTLEDLVGEATARPRLLSRGMGIFAVLACILAGVGIYAVLSQFVAERRRDIGLRIALGARPAQVVRLVVGRALVFVAVGITVGTLSSVAVVRLAAAVVQGLRLSSLMGHLAAATAVTVIAVVASVAPAMNAAKVDPWSVLRDE